MTRLLAYTWILSAILPALGCKWDPAEDNTGGGPGSSSTSTGMSSGGPDSTTDDGTTGAPACSLPGYALQGPYPVTTQEKWGYDRNDPMLVARGAGTHALLYQTLVPHTISWRMFDSIGEPITDVVVEVPAEETGQMRPAIAMDDAGRVVVGWGVNNELGQRLLVQRHDSDGAPLGAPIQVDQPPVMNAPLFDGRGVGLAMNGAGKFAVAWGTYDGSGISLYLRRYAADGTPLADQLAIDPKEGRLTLGPVTLAMDAAGGVLMVWGDGWAGQGFRMQRFAPDGAEQTGVVTLPIPDVKLYYPPTAAMAPDGRAVIVYYLQYGVGVFGQRVDPQGALVGAAVKLNDTLADDAEVWSSEDPHSANVAMADDGSFVVSWMTRLEEPRIQSIRRFDADAAPIGPSTVLCQPEKFRGAPSLATAGGQIFVGSVALEGDSEERIYISRLTPE